VRSPLLVDHGHPGSVAGSCHRWPELLAAVAGAGVRIRDGEPVSGLDGCPVGLAAAVQASATRTIGRTVLRMVLSERLRSLYAPSRREDKAVVPEGSDG